MTDKERAIAVFKSKIEWGKEKRYPFISNEEVEACKLAIKVLEQEPILDKIRAEIERITDTMGVSYNQYVRKIDVLQIIDKYREPQAESEG